jgi:superfamily II DNA or RNA helicase
MRRLLTSRLKTQTEPRFEQDWARQRRTANDILHRLQTKEGVILADQVGMGKTYVALAVVVSHILSTPDLGRVVIFVPAAVADKWVREWQKFSESLLDHGTGIRCVNKPIRSGEELLKKLDDSKDDREHILVVTHTALTATLKDTFIQLALLHYATRYVRDGADLRGRIAKWSDGLRGLIRNAQFTPERVHELLQTPPSKWRACWLRLTGENLPDNPVPEALESAARSLQLQELRTAINRLPIRSSADIQRRLEDARKALATATQATWKWLLSSTDLDLPLLVVEEAHRLKNPSTQISKLFAARTSNEGAGAFRGIFRRMLFLTATPFELGHSELIEVLSRMSALRPLDPVPTSPLEDRLAALKKKLTNAQATALTLDVAWGRLSRDDLAAFDSWGPNAPAPMNISPSAREAWEHAKYAVRARQEMNRALKPWVIRHERVHRRVYHSGAAIVAGDASKGGLPIAEENALPFLLAARAQSIALDDTSARPLFAYGIASSYEAFRRLGSGQPDEARDFDFPPEDCLTDGPEAASHRPAVDPVRWYRDEIDRALGNANILAAHPKVRATVEKAAQLWLAGEKCLIFCWFIKTGEAVERALAKRVDDLMLETASTALRTKSVDDTRVELERLSDRLFRRDASSYDRIRKHLVDALADASGRHEDVIDLVVDAAIRHLRTPSYLTRYTPLSLSMTDEDVWNGISKKSPHGIVLLNRWQSFAERLARARLQIETVGLNEQQDSEFARVSEALLGARAEDDELHRRGASLHPVRRAHGGTKRDVRERLIALFNTPLSPDLLVASSVMGEGIDLHQECRFVIHHDLDWNPSVLEQRTGRLDRIGALAEREGRDIEVYEPYLAGTHDEKMFRVVKDRAQWFDIVMGRPAGAEEHATDAEEHRLPLHGAIREALAMDLRSPE